MIILTTLLLVVGAAASCTPGLDFPNQDLPGSPLRGISSADACETLCEANPACETFVFISPQCPAGSGASQCYLKAGVPPSKPQLPCYCGGQVLRPPPPPQPPSPGPTRFTLISGALTASLGDRGLVGLALDGGASIGVGADGWSVLVDGVMLNSSSLPDPIASQDGGVVTYVYSDIPGAGVAKYTAIATYTLPPVGGPFVRKALVLASSTPSTPLDLGLVSPWDSLYLTLPSPLVGALYPSGDMGTYGVFLRTGDGTGLTVAAENPFLAPTAAPAFAPNGALVSVSYAPGLVWDQITPSDPTPQPFTADAGLLGLYPLSVNAVPPSTEGDTSTRRFGATRPYLRKLRAAGTSSSSSSSSTSTSIETTDTLTGMAFEYEPLQQHLVIPSGLHLHRHAAQAPLSWLNYAERDAFRGMGEAAFAAAHGGSLPEPLRVHIPWTENDYQIDVANATQWPEYQRIMEMLGKMGVERILYAGVNSDVSNRSASTDDWHWEMTLFLAMGEQIRTGQWAPGEPIPPSVLKVIDSAAANNVSAIPYVYPILGFTGGPNHTNPTPWLAPDGHGHIYARLSSRAFQDYFIGLSVNFSLATGARGAGYDYTFLWEGSNTTVYAQWAGWRRVLMSVRSALTWGGEGSSSSSTEAYVVDNRQQSHSWSPWMWAAGSYAEPLQSDEQTTSWTAFLPDIHIDRGDANRQREINYNYAQVKLCQPSAMPGFFHHNTDRGDGRMSDLTIRDYDFYATPYALVSAIATGGLNAVVCDIPARDEGEFTAFPALAPDNHTTSLALYHFWFDWARTHAPHLRALKFLPQPPGPGAIDGTYAVVGGLGFLFLFNPNPQPMTTPPGLLTATAVDLDLGFCGAQGGSSSSGSSGSVTVGELFPFPTPALMVVPCGSNFSVALEGRSARVLTLAPTAPGDASAAAAATASRANPAFVHNQAVAGMGFNASFSGGTLLGRVRVPGVVLEQLAARGAAYPVPWTPEDAAIAWLNPSRLMLSIDTLRGAMGGSGAVITARLDGVALPVNPVWSCRTLKVEKCFQGWFMDLSAAGVQGDQDYSLEVTLPSVAPGEFLGVYYDNVDTVF